MKTVARLVLAAAGMTLGLAGAAAAQPQPQSGDEILRVGGVAWLTRALPWGPDRAPGTFSQQIEELAFLADGSMVAITVERYDHGAARKIFLNRVSEAGVVTLIGQVPSVGGEEALDLKAGRSGKLYLLTLRFPQPDPPGIYRLVQLDPETGAVVHDVVGLPQYTDGLAAGPDELWALIEGRLRTLDPQTGRAGYPGWPLEEYFPDEIDVDSSGGIWFWNERVCTPPCYSWYRLDTHTGAVALHYGLLSDQQLALKDLAIRRRCQASDTATCLQGGRFRATVTWKDFQGAAGDGKVAAGRSADSGLFYFFERRNWELVVKVLNGCFQNGYFWVFGSASTDVEYSLTVEDLEKGTSRTYGNPLGQPSKAITDSTAFSCY